MTEPCAENLWTMNDSEFMSLLVERCSEEKPRRIRFYAPSFMHYKSIDFCSRLNDFPTISVTGKGCSLKCKHCGGIVLNTMYPATTPAALYELCKRLKSDGARGCLISGGCLPNGSVPLKEFVDTICRVKRDFGLTVFVHTGIIDHATAEALKNANVDAALFDIIGSEETIKDVYRLDISLKDYKDSLRALNDAQIVYVPHVIVGLHHGKLMGEFTALKMVSSFRPSALVIIAFMPIRGTEMASVKPPESIDIAKVIFIARKMFPRTPLVLGCMRSQGRERSQTEILAMQAGIDAIAFPTEPAVKFAKNSGCIVSFSPMCCAQIYLDAKNSVISGSRQLPS